MATNRTQDEERKKNKNKNENKTIRQQTQIR